MNEECTKRFYFLFHFTTVAVVLRLRVVYFEKILFYMTYSSICTMYTLATLKCLVPFHGENINIFARIDWTENIFLRKMNPEVYVFWYRSREPLLSCPRKPRNICGFEWNVKNILRVCIFDVEKSFSDLDGLKHYLIPVPFSNIFRELRNLHKYSPRHFSMYRDTASKSVVQVLSSGYSSFSNASDNIRSVQN